MKALKSELAKKVLADPKQRAKLLDVVASKHGLDKARQETTVVSGNRQYRPVVVSKAA